MKKSVLYYVCLRELVRGFFYKCSKGLFYSVMCLCQPFLVMWLTCQTELTELVRVLRPLVTAYYYKLCDKVSFLVPIFNTLGSFVFKNTAIRFQLFDNLVHPWRIHQGDQYPPPHEKLTGSTPPPPLLPFINCNLFQNPFSFPIGLYLGLCFRSLPGQRGSGGKSQVLFSLGGLGGKHGC